MPPSEELRFAVIAIETAAQKMGITTAELTNRLHDIKTMIDTNSFFRL